MVVEVMGRYAGWIALNAGVAAGAHAILIPEIPFSLEPVAKMIKGREARGASFAIVVVAEGAMPKDGQRSVVGTAVDQSERLGGIGHAVAQQLTALTGKLLIVESVVIAEYLEERFPEPALLPSAPLRKASTVSWSRSMSRELTTCR